MLTLKGVQQQAAAMVRLVTSPLYKAAALLDPQFEALSLQNMSRCVNSVLTALRGQGASVAPAVLHADDPIEIASSKKVLEGTISVSGHRLDTLLSELSFNQSRQAQAAYAAQLGYRLATREEHLAYVTSLLTKEAEGAISPTESSALDMYRKRYVRDNQGGLFVFGSQVLDFDDRWGCYDGPKFGALFVRDSTTQR